MAERERVPSPEGRPGRRLADASARRCWNRRKELTAAAGSRERGAPPPADGEARQDATRSTGRTARSTLLDLFEGRRQLIVYHFMFDPAWEKGCPGCTGYVDALGDLSMLAKRNTSFVLDLARAAREARRLHEAKGWQWPWYSSFGSDFNYDFHVTLDESVRPSSTTIAARRRWKQPSCPTRPRARSTA